MEVIMEVDYKIFKLKSGEEIIGLIDSQDDMTIKISRPMVVKSVLMVDNSGYPKEVMIMRNWLELTNLVIMNWLRGQATELTFIH